MLAPHVVKKSERLCLTPMRNIACHEEVIHLVLPQRHEETLKRLAVRLGPSQVKVRGVRQPEGHSRSLSPATRRAAEMQGALGSLRNSKVGVRSDRSRRPRVQNSPTTRVNKRPRRTPPRRGLNTLQSTAVYYCARLRLDCPPAFTVSVLYESNGRSRDRSSPRYPRVTRHSPST